MSHSTKVVLDFKRLLIKINNLSVISQKKSLLMRIFLNTKSNADLASRKRASGGFLAVRRENLTASVRRRAPSSRELHSPMNLTSDRSSLHMFKYITTPYYIMFKYEEDYSFLQANIIRIWIWI